MSVEISENIVKVFKFYDLNKIKYKQFFKKIKNYSFENSTNDNNKSIINFIDSENNVFEQSNYEILGYYVSKKQSWIWSWFVFDIHKNQTELARQILNYGLNLDQLENNSFLNFIRLYLLSASFNANEYLVELIVAVSLYITKKGTIYKIRHHDQKKEKFVDQYIIIYPKLN